MTELGVLPHLAMLLVRPGALLAVAPGIGGAFVPPHVKIGLTVLVALGLAPAVAVPPAMSAGDLGAVVAREMAIGLSLGLAMRAVVGGAELAGHLSGFQLGFSYAATVDPGTGARNSVITSLFGLVALLAIFGLDAHHAMLRALASSYERLPVGTGGIGESLLASVRDVFAIVFVIGVRLAAPVVVVLVLLELAFGLIGRSAPALNIVSVGYPVRLVVGLVVLGLAVTTVPRIVAGTVGRALAIAAEMAGAFR